MDRYEIQGYGRYRCEVVQKGSKFKMLGSKAGSLACPKPPNFVFTTGRIVLKFGDKLYRM